MFAGGGVSWAEDRMKEGQFEVPMAAPDTFPDLEGLSCRWTPMETKNGQIVSLVVSPRKDAAPRAVTKVLHDIVAISEGLEGSGNPIHPEGPGFSWPPSGLDIEARASHGTQSVFRRKIRLAFDTLLALGILKSGVKVGGFDPRHYLDTAVANADFRKFDDGLKMTLDCDHQTISDLRAYLEKARAEGVIDFGMVEQNSALVTCIVPSVTQDDHIHFVDGAAGGYAAAASQMKRSIGA